MNRTSLLCAVSAASALLVAPASALAAGSVIAGPVKAKGYTLTITATDAGAADSLSVTAVKRAGGSQQLHSWSFTGAKVTIKGATATIKGSLGRYGAINAKVKGAGKVKGIVPAGCTGTAGSASKGTLVGKTKLVLDSTFFKTVKPKSVKAQIIRAGKLDCTTGGGGSTGQHGLMLMSTLQNDAGTLSVSVNKAGSKVTQTVMRTDAPATAAPASVFHMISATTGESGLNAAPDLQNASAPATGPFLTGQLAFAGTPMGTMATGTVSGDFAAKFDSIGEQRLPEGTDGMLISR
jgi:hypothetical protein